jgi:hypothetical protein
VADVTKDTADTARRGSAAAASRRADIDNLSARQPSPTPGGRQYCPFETGHTNCGWIPAALLGSETRLDAAVAARPNAISTDTDVDLAADPAPERAREPRRPPTEPVVRYVAIVSQLVLFGVVGLLMAYGILKVN